MSSQSAERIGGWLLAPLAWLLLALLSTSLSLILYANALMAPQTWALLKAMSFGHLALWLASLLFAVAMWYYTLWLTIAFFKRRAVVPKHYIIWLLISLLLAIKAFAFSPISIFWPCASCCFRCSLRHCLRPIFDALRGLSGPSSIRNNHTVHLLSPVSIYSIIGGFFSFQVQ